MDTRSLNVVPSRPVALREPVHTTSVGTSFKVDDLAYILFRHKWKILICLVAGLVTAAVIWYTHRSTYVSEAKLLIRYVRENRSADTIDTADQIRSPDKGGESIISSERELLGSLDLALEVAQDVGASNILRAVGGGTSDQQAAAVIRKGLQVQSKPKSNVIAVSFEHPDASVTRPVVAALIERYLKMHGRIHRAVEALNDLARQVDQKRNDVASTETELRNMKRDLGIISVQDTLKALSEQIARLKTEILDTEASLVESRTVLGRLTNGTPIPVTPNRASTATNAPYVSPDAEKQYQSVLARLESLRRHEQGLLLQFKPTSIYVKRVAGQITDAQIERDQLVAATPGLTNITIAQLNGAEPNKNPINPNDPTATLSRVASLEAKVAFLNQQLDKTQTEALKIADKESAINQLERKRVTAEKHYTYASTSLEEARADEAVSNSRMSNIAVVQEASPPFPNTDQITKLLAAASFGGLAFGLSIAVFIEFFADQSVRRPRQITESIGLPLFLSLPKLRRKRPAGENHSKSTKPDSQSEIVDPDDLNKYSEALRDRIIMHFQLRELNHKPKLIGVTSCGHGAGVTTIATSLAATLSETGEGNVLYVDVNQDSAPAAHPFRRGKPTPNISDALAHETRESAMISENLYVVSLAEPGTKRVGILPKKLASLVPQIKASDYDYIIFDLPPVTQTSAAARISGLLDVTVMVLESEKTHRDLAGQAVNLLSESNTQMVAVLNKHRRYLPPRLDGDL